MALDDLGPILVANRGEIARKIIATARRFHIRTIAVYTKADESWPHWREADTAVLIGEGPADESYLNIEKIVQVARSESVRSVHPGYGFLAENVDFVRACVDAGLIFIGPSPDAMRKMGSKSEAKRLMESAGIPILPGYHGEDQAPDLLREQAAAIGYPVLIKAVAGGGGRGMRLVEEASAFDDNLVSAQREAASAFNDSRVLLEKPIRNPRHVEVQILGDTFGNIVHLLERDCSLQRRHQKIIEEAPAPGLGDDLRRALFDAAVTAAGIVKYTGAGTVEFLLEARSDGGGFYFMEMNPRLQVEHPVTEAITGIDLIEQQLRIAAGEPLSLRQSDIAPTGHAIEARLYAEDPARNFVPTTGVVEELILPKAAEGGVDCGISRNTRVSAFYDPLLMKITATGQTRDEALARLRNQLAVLKLAGLETNQGFLSAILESQDFSNGSVATSFVDANLPRFAARDPSNRAVAGAVLAWFEQKPDPGAQVLGRWAARDGYQPGGLARQRDVPFAMGGISHVAHVTWDAFAGAHVRYGESAVTGKDIQAGDYYVTKETVQAFNNGFPFVLKMADAVAIDAGNTAGAGPVSCPVTGRVTAVMVKSGMLVSRSDPLITIESMKMEHSVCATHGGRIVDVFVSEGQSVDAGAPAVEIAEENED